MHDTSLDFEQLPDLGAYVDRQSALELARRSLLGAPVFAIVSLIMLAGTPMLTDYGAWSIAEAILLVLLGAIRVWFALKFEQHYDRIGEQAVNQFSILTAIQSLVLGILSAMVIWHYWAVQEVVLTIVLAAGCVAAGTSALSVRRSAQMIFLVCILAPFGIAVYLVGGLARAAIIVGFLALMAFLVQDGGQAKHAYLKRLKEHYGEKIARRRLQFELQTRQGYINAVSQEIRAPVNSIVDMTALLLDEKLDGRSREIAETIRKSANSLWSLIGDATGSIKTLRDVTESKFGVLNLKACIKNTMDVYRLEASEKGLELTAHIEEIPENITSCDHRQLEQVLSNLLTNAVSYTEEGSVTLSASCESLHDGTLLIEFSLADTGPGIAVEKRESVFSPFNEKGVKTSGKFGGDGLGLPLCKGLVELLGGDIWIEDNNDRGTMVKFTIHAELDPSDIAWGGAEATRLCSTDPVVRPFPVITGTLSDRHPHNILIVDDHDIQRKIICAQLRKLGYAPDEAADGEQAIAAVMKNFYDLIFMDLRMPHMDGIESTRWIRERFNDNELQIIAVTGEATIEARESCVRAGMDNFVVKPIQVKDLEAILRHTRHGQKFGPTGTVMAEVMH
ncbi:response regulator [Pseudomonadota bacterium]